MRTTPWRRRPTLYGGCGSDADCGAVAPAQRGRVYESLRLPIHGLRGRHCAREREQRRAAVAGCLAERGSRPYRRGRPRLWRSPRLSESDFDLIQQCKRECLPLSCLCASSTYNCVPESMSQCSLVCCCTGVPLPVVRALSLSLSVYVCACFFHVQLCTRNMLSGAQLYVAEAFHTGGERLCALWYVCIYGALSLSLSDCTHPTPPHSLTHAHTYYMHTPSLSLLFLSLPLATHDTQQLCGGMFLRTSSTATVSTQA